ncbi:MAG: glycosyltransferase family 2 protein [Planctomycetes bacterium]|nr:glycosyltransferase family 2 protein [Planctomycetota bacterium]
MTDLSIIIPALNETEGIRVTLDRLRDAVRGIDAEIIVVDDGSTDDTALQAEAAGVRVIRHEKNRGYGAALKTGIRHARAEVIGIADADGTYPVERLAGLFQEMGSTYDMVVGARTGARVAIPPLRRPAKLALNVLANVLTGQKIPDLNSGLRVFRRAVAEKYIHFLPSGFSFTSTITLAMLNDDYLVKFVPIDYYPRAGKSKIRALRDTSGFLLLILRVTMYFNPLKIFLPVSGLLLLATAAAFVFDLHSAAGLSDKTVVLSLATGMVFLVGLLADAVAHR